MKKHIKFIGNKYDYSKVEYINNHTKVCIICSIHGEFWQTPQNHLNGCGCKKCSCDKKWKKRKKLTTEDFIKRAKEVHGNKYDYSKVVYINSTTKVCIICPIHGEFWQIPNKHLNGCQCKKCASIKSNINRKLTTEDFIKRAKEVHGNKYDYSKAEYINATSKICIICKKHGEFYQESYSHLKGCGCPICKESKLEKLTRDILNKYNINFISQKRFDWLGRQSLDFYLPEYNIAIECQGIQHYKCNTFYSEKNNFLTIKNNDNKKKILCEYNNIKIIYIPYNMNEKQINNLIKKLIC